MEKKYLFLVLLLLTVGFASVNTVLDLKGNVSIGFKYDDFNIYISKIYIDGKKVPTAISEDKQSFTYIGTGSNNIEYTITNKSYQYDADVKIICSPNDEISINQIGVIEAQSRKKETIESNTSNEVTCKIEIEKISKTEIAKDMCQYSTGNTWEFNYTGGEQTFTAPCDGEYKIELWGAQGGGKSIYVGGLGAYTSGEIDLEANTSLYLIVGGAGSLPTNSSNITGGFNGGGGTYGSPAGNVYYNIAGTGGGATDVRISSSTIIYDSTHKTYMTNINNLYKRIMVAAGGGGGTSGDIDGWKSTGYGASAGGLIGYDGVGTYYGDDKKTIGGSQISGGAGQIVTTRHAGNYVHAGLGYGGAQGWAPWGGGGAGYYGGGSGGGWSGAGAGGSSFISGHDGCNAVNSSGSHTGQPNHYSGYVFTDTIMIDGAGYKWTNVKGEYTGMPTHDGKSTMTGNSGNGYAKITLVSID